MIEQSKQNILPQLLGAGGDEARAITGLPQRGLTEGINAKIAQDKATIPQSELTGTQAQAQLPQAGMTAIAGQQQLQDKQFNDVADRFVEDLYVKKGRKLPTADEAYTASQSDERVRPFGTAITPAYYGQAIVRLRARLADEATKRLAANARFAGAAGTGLDDLARVYKSKIDNLNSQLTNLLKVKGIKPTDQYASAAIANAAKTGRKPSAMMLEGAKRWADYQKEAADLQSQMNFYQQKLDQVLAPAMGASPPPSPESVSQQRRDWDRLAEKYGKDRTTKEIGPRP
jgi:hypothetical protein